MMIIYKLKKIYIMVIICKQFSNELFIKYNVSILYLYNLKYIFLHIFKVF